MWQGGDWVSAYDWVGLKSGFHLKVTITIATVMHTSVSTPKLNPILSLLSIQRNRWRALDVAYVVDIPGDIGPLVEFIEKRTIPDQEKEACTRCGQYTCKSRCEFERAEYIHALPKSETTQRDQRYFSNWKARRYVRRVTKAIALYVHGIESVCQEHLLNGTSNECGGDRDGDGPWPMWRGHCHLNHKLVRQHMNSWDKHAGTRL